MIQMVAANRNFTFISIETAAAAASSKTSNRNRLQRLKHTHFYLHFRLEYDDNRSTKWATGDVLMRAKITTTMQTKWLLKIKQYWKSWRNNAMSRHVSSIHSIWCHTTVQMFSLAARAKRTARVFVWLCVCVWAHFFIPVFAVVCVIFFSLLNSIK